MGWQQDPEERSGRRRSGALFTYASGTPILVPTSTNQLANQLSAFNVHEPGAGRAGCTLADVNCHCFDPTKTLVLNPAASIRAGTRLGLTAFYNDHRYQRHPVENFNMGRNFTIKNDLLSASGRSS